MSVPPSTSPHYDELPTQSPQWGPRTKRLMFVILLVTIVVLGYFMVEILPLVIVAALLAFLLTPLTTFIQRRVLVIPPFRHSRGLAAVMSFVVAIFLITVVLLVIIPTTGEQVEDFVNTIPDMLADVEDTLEEVLSQPLMFRGEPILLEGEPIVPLDRIAEATGATNLNDVIRLSDIDLTQAAGTFFGSVSTLTGPAFSFVGGAFNTVINLTFLIMMTFYLLKDGGAFVEGFVNLAPDGYESDVRRIFTELGIVWNGYIRGQALLCIVMGVVVYIAAMLLGVPNAPILGLLSGILEFIPNLGPLLALVPAAFLGLVSESQTLPFLSGVPFAIVIIVVWTMLQNIEAVFLVPRIMGDSLHLHPFVVIIGVLGGAALAGALGVILAAPFIASGRVIGRYIYGKLTGRSPFLENPPDEGQEPTMPRFLVRWYRYLRLKLYEARTERSPV